MLAWPRKFMQQLQLILITSMIKVRVNSFRQHWVNNASTIGLSPMPFLLDYPLEDFRNVINTNLIAPFLMIKKALPAMIENGGSIINVTSDAGVNGYPGWGAYGISKFGIEGMSQTWAAELEDSGVRVNWVGMDQKQVTL